MGGPEFGGLYGVPSSVYIVAASECTQEKKQRPWRGARPSPSYSSHSSDLPFREPTTGPAHKHKADPLFYPLADLHSLRPSPKWPLPISAYQRSLAFLPQSARIVAQSIIQNHKNEAGGFWKV